MAFDPIDNYTLLFGGEEENAATGSANMNDTWIYENHSWVNITLTSGIAPPGNAYRPLVFDAADGYMLLIDRSCPFCNDTWSFLHGKWRQIPINDTNVLVQLNTQWVTAAYDSTARQVVVDAIDTTYLYHNGTYADVGFNQTANRTNPTPNFQGGIMVDDPSVGGVLFFGGEVPDVNQVYGPSNVTWVFSNGAWVNLTSSVGPAPNPRVYAAGDFDMEQDRVLITGGTQSIGPWIGPEVSGTWEFSSRWVNVTNSPPPNVEAGGSMTWDVADNVSLLFGGTEGYTASDATWVWSGTPFVAGLRAAAAPNPVEVGSQRPLRRRLLEGSRRSTTRGSSETGVRASSRAPPTHTCRPESSTSTSRSATTPSILCASRSI